VADPARHSRVESSWGADASRHDSTDLHEHALALGVEQTWLAIQLDRETHIETLERSSEAQRRLR
jgi:hypothetical protein